ncbi:hypothetical protein [Polyangium sp. 15x6]|nr:hypothetical protein [Polyangium sp. 15x6]MDI3290287.1 hypothetical protein [Polyangium sp. 15x6]
MPCRQHAGVIYVQTSALGAEQVGDLVLDLSPEELAAWLSSKN